MVRTMNFTDNNSINNNKDSTGGVCSKYSKMETVLRVLRQAPVPIRYFVRAKKVLDKKKN